MRRPKSETKPDSRLRWLFFETLVIVLGVLVALAINDWWEERQDRERERDYLTRLLNEVIEDELALDRIINDRPDLKLENLEAIAPIVRRQQPVPDDVMEFLTTVSRGGAGGFAVANRINRNTYDDLVSTGNLRLINDTELRHQIADYYQEMEFRRARLAPRVSGYVPFVHAHIPAELRDNMTLEAVEPFVIERAVAAFTSPEFESLLNQEINLALFMRDSNAHEMAVQFRGILEAKLAVTD